MPTYLCQCRICGKELEYWSTIKARKRVPDHCGKKTKRILNAPMVAPMFQEYRAVGIPGAPIIKTKAEHIATLRRHNKIEVGNDTSQAAPKMAPGEFEHQKNEQLKEIKRDFEVLSDLKRELATI